MAADGLLVAEFHRGRQREQAVAVAKVRKLNWPSRTRSVSPELLPIATLIDSGVELVLFDYRHANIPAVLPNTQGIISAQTWAVLNRRG